MPRDLSVRVAHKDTKANIEALTGIEQGAHAYATDTDEPGWFDGTDWQWGTWGTGSAGAETLNELSDVSASSPSIGDALVWSGTEWGPGGIEGELNETRKSMRVDLRGTAVPDLVSYENYAGWQLAAGEEIYITETK